MNERDDGEPQLPTILPDGQEFVAGNKYEQSLADRMVLSVEDNPVDFIDLGDNIFGSHFNSETFGGALNSLIDNLNEKLKEKKWQIANNGLTLDEQKLWLEKVPEEIKVDIKDMVVVDEARRALEVFAQDFSSNFIEKLSIIDKANIQEAMFQDPKKVKAEIDDVTKTVAKVKSGEFQVPKNSQLLEGTTVDKIDLVKDRLKGLLAMSLVDPKNKTVRSKFGWGKELNEMMLFAGGGDAGREVVCEAIFNLNSVEQALVLSQMSMTKRYEILLVGLDEINEREMAGFISNATFKFNKSADTEELEQIVSSIMARDNLHGFEPGKVIDALEAHYPNRTDIIYREMINAARQADFVHDLMGFFSSNELTARWATKLEEGFGDDPGYIRIDRRI